VNIESVVRNNTIEAHLRLQSLGFNQPWWKISLSSPPAPVFVRKWQRIRDAHGNVVGYVSPDLRCPFSGGMIVRKP
jgi:hypothetical protein